MHYRIELQGEKKDVAAKLLADNGPSDAVAPLFKAAKQIALAVLSPLKDDRKCEVIGYFATGEPEGSVSFSLKVEGQ
jgi:hypothetical protein